MNTKFYQATDYTDYTDFNHKTHKTHQMPRRRADNIPKDFMVKQNVDHE